MKEQELRKSAKCSNCKKLIGHTGLPLFWKVKIERFSLDMKAIQRLDGLGAMLNSSVLASVMGPDEDLAKPVMEPIEVTLCEECAMTEIVIAYFIEKD